MGFSSIKMKYAENSTAQKIIVLYRTRLRGLDIEFRQSYNQRNHRQIEIRIDADHTNSFHQRNTLRPAEISHYGLKKGHEFEQERNEVVSREPERTIL